MFMLMVASVTTNEKIKKKYTVAETGNLETWFEQAGQSEFPK
jgi:hypothetical protein